MFQNFPILSAVLSALNFAFAVIGAMHFGDLLAKWVKLRRAVKQGPVVETIPIKIEPVYHITINGNFKDASEASHASIMKLFERAAKDEPS